MVIGDAQDDRDRGGMGEVFWGDNCRSTTTGERGYSKGAPHIRISRLRGYLLIITSAIFAIFGPDNCYLKINNNQCEFGLDQKKKMAYYV